MSRASTTKKFFDGNRIGRTPKFSAGQILAIQEDLRAPGITREEVARKHGLSPMTVRNYFDKFGTPTAVARKVLAGGKKKTSAHCELDGEFDQDRWGS